MFLRLGEQLGQWRDGEVLYTVVFIRKVMDCLYVCHSIRQAAIAHFQVHNLKKKKKKWNYRRNNTMQGTLCNCRHYILELQWICAKICMHHYQNNYSNGNAKPPLYWQPCGWIPTLLCVLQYGLLVLNAVWTNDNPQYNDTDRGGTSMIWSLRLVFRPALISGNESDSKTR